MPEYIPVAFGDRLRQMRREMGLTQDEFAQKLGTSKQVLSRYETNQRIPKVTQARKYADKLGVSLDYMLGTTDAEAAYEELLAQPKKKPFYKIFLDVAEEMGLDIPGIARVTGMTDWQVRTVIMRQMKDAPLPLALQLTDTMGVPLEVWAGDMPYVPAGLSVEAREVARVYDGASTKDKNTVRAALELEPVEAGT